MSHRSRGAALAPLGMLALTGCFEQQKPVVQLPPAIVYSVDTQGQARLCTVPKPAVLAERQAVQLQMVVGNDGGWCGIEVSLPGPQPFSAGLLSSRPAHGSVYVHTVGYETRLDYTPEPGYAGADGFAVQLLPGDETVRVAVMVQPGMVQPGMAAPGMAAPGMVPPGMVPPGARPGAPMPPPLPATRR